MQLKENCLLLHSLKYVIKKKICFIQLSSILEMAHVIKSGSLEIKRTMGYFLNSFWLLVLVDLIKSQKSWYYVQPWLQFRTSRHQSLTKYSKDQMSFTVCLLSSLICYVSCTLFSSQNFEKTSLLLQIPHWSTSDWKQMSNTK